MACFANGCSSPSVTLERRVFPSVSWLNCRTFLAIMAVPVVAVAMFAFGLLAAATHLVALPGLFLWERYLEARPVRGHQSDQSVR